MRLIAVGDIHGCLDQLKVLLAKINPCPADQLVFLGDYIDRGPDSCGVLDFLTVFQSLFTQTVFLRGNHEQLMLDALTESGTETSVPFLYAVSELWDRETAWMRNSNAKNYLLWHQNHGDLTLKSYGIDPPLRLDDIRKAFARIPAEHIEFLASTVLWHEYDHYLFVHAGVSPGEDLADQDPYELLWSREGFWKYQSGWNQCVVHGHTPVPEPRIERLEISLDTGAGTGGPLSACDVRTGEVWQG